MKNWEFFNEVTGEAQSLEEQAIIITVRKITEKIEQALNAEGIELPGEIECDGVYETYKQVYGLLNSDKE